MPPRRKRPATKAAVTSRVHKIASGQQWESMLQKAGENRIVVVQFLQATVWACQQMRPFFTKHSTSPKCRKVIFAEVNVDEHEDIAKAAGVTRLPTYQCYYQGEMVDSYSGGKPEEMQQFIHRCVTEYCLSSEGPLIVAAKLGAAALLLAGGAFLYARLRGENGAGGGSGGGGSDSGSQLLDVKKRIMAAQGKLRALEKANRGKQARMQRKLLEKLNAERASLERGKQAARTKGGAAAAAAAAGRAGDGAAGGASRGARRSAAVDFDIDAVARLRHRRRQGEVLYSDEEDALVAAEQAGDGYW